MKKILAFIICLIPFLALSQTVKPIDSLTRIQFGSRFKAVIETVKANGGKWDTEHSDSKMLAFASLKFDGNSSSYFVVKFSVGAAYEIDYLIHPNSTDVIGYYDGLVKKLNKAYGAGKSTRNFKAPYKSGDGNELEAIKSGSAEFSAFWAVNGKTITISIDTNLIVLLGVQDDELRKAAFVIQNGGH